MKNTFTPPSCERRRSLRHSFLVVALAMLLAPIGAWADNIGVAKLEGTTLTFTVADESTVNGSTVFKVPSSADIPDWYSIGSTVTKVVFEDVFATIKPSNTYWWFCGLTSLETIEGMGNLDTSKAWYMDRMFYNCSKLTSLDLSHFDTSSAEGMQEMFYGCSSLTSLDLSTFNTSNVSEMTGMFSGCQKLETIAFGSNFNTGKVTYMQNMFYNCRALNSLDVSGFDTRNVTTMSGMFNNCTALATLNVSNFDTGNVTSLEGMFRNCSSLTSIDVSHFNTGKVTSMFNMFQNCGVTSLDISNFTIGSSTRMGGFAQSSKLETLTLGGNDLSSVTEKSYAFQNVGSSTSPCKLTIYDTFDKSVLGEERTGGFYVWLTGYFAIDKVVSGIKSVKGEEGSVKNQNATMYNLKGQRVGKNYRGVVIQNGRKTIKKHMK